MKQYIKAEIKFDSMFETPAKVFCEYAKKKGMNFCEGEEGFILKQDTTLSYEQWKIAVAEGRATVYASSEKGMHNALAKVLHEIVNERVYLSSMEESPAMPYRGLAVDLARQKHSIEYILKYIDLCYKERATHLQLHFADDESFTLPIKAYPELATEGRTYTYDEIKTMVNYANDRGIKIVPDVDVPGHTKQFCLKYPELFGTLNVLPACQEVFDALKTIYAEVVEMFPYSELINIGGDEAGIKRWSECEKTKQYMKDNNIQNADEMYAEYIRVVTEIILDLGRQPLVYEGFAKEYNHLISKDVIVICWESYYQAAYELAKAGFRLINCSWKPLYIVAPRVYWNEDDIENWDPWTWQHWWEKSIAYPDGYTIDKNNSEVLGGQLCAWGDFLRDYDDWEKGANEELTLIEKNLPVLCKKLIKGE